jgi:hypothetical protein
MIINNVVCEVGLWCAITLRPTNDYMSFFEYQTIPWKTSYFFKLLKALWKQQKHIIYDGISMNLRLLWCFQQISGYK